MRARKDWSLQQRLDNRTRKGSFDECWIWTGALNSKGYGTLRFEGSGRLAHRLAWIAAYGDPPVGADILHACDNPKCVNPKHLFHGTHADNMADKARKGRAHKPTGVLNGRAILNVKKVRRILAMKKWNPRPAAWMVGMEFGVNKATVLAIWKGRIWKHVNGGADRTPRQPVHPEGGPPA